MIDCLSVSQSVGQSFSPSLHLIPFGQLLRCADKCINCVTIIKVYIARNNLQVELIFTLFMFTFAKRGIQCNIAHRTQIYYNDGESCQTVYIVTVAETMGVDTSRWTVVTSGRLCWPVDAQSRRFIQTLLLVVFNVYLHHGHNIRTLIMLTVGIIKVLELILINWSVYEKTEHHVLTVRFCAVLSHTKSAIDTDYRRK